MVLQFNINDKEYVVGDDEQNMKHTDEYYADMFDYQSHPKKYIIIENRYDLQYFGKGIHHILKIKNKLCVG